MVTESLGVRPVVQINMDALTIEDLDKNWPVVQLGKLKSEGDDNGDTNVAELTAYPILSSGAKGTKTQRLQQALIDQGYLSGKADGDFGKKTEEAVKKAQKAFGMEQTGIADDVFQKRLYGEWTY